MPLIIMLLGIALFFLGMFLLPKPVSNEQHDKELEALRQQHLATVFKLGVSYGVLAKTMHPEETANQSNARAIAAGKGATKQSWEKYLP